ncbi:MAG: hypothetical protein ARM1_0767 [Candidatus Micrarchaeota archaeon]|nr:MAG: hypothetical protein ARM1_0767 [Candidatus Micrarchaeota archaeon]
MEKGQIVAAVIVAVVVIIAAYLIINKPSKSYNLTTVYTTIQQRSLHNTTSKASIKTTSTTISTTITTTVFNIANPSSHKIVYNFTPPSSIANFSLNSTYTASVTTLANYVTFSQLNTYIGYIGNSKYYMDIAITGYSNSSVADSLYYGLISSINSSNLGVSKLNLSINNSNISHYSAFIEQRRLSYVLAFVYKDFLVVINLNSLSNQSNQYLSSIDNLLYASAEATIEEISSSK